MSLKTINLAANEIVGLYEHSTTIDEISEKNLYSLYECQITRISHTARAFHLLVNKTIISTMHIKNYLVVLEYVAFKDRNGRTEVAKLRERVLCQQGQLFTTKLHTEEIRALLSNC